MDQNDLIEKLKSFSFALRHGQTEKVLATLVLGLFATGTYLLQEWKEFPKAAYLAYALCAAFGLWLTYRIWKVATHPPAPPPGPVSSAIKGLSPFTVADGKLFTQLGRQMELQQLLGLTRDDQIAISAVRGESGAGKTSLLQAGVAYSLGEEQCVYWEAVSEKAAEALLHAIRSRFPGIDSLESLPEACPKRCVLVLDQFEQLRMGEPAHASVFALLDRIAKAPAPHNLSAIIGFRREFVADWLDFEQTRGFRAEQVPINLLAQRTACDTLVTLVGEVGFTVDQALVENFISGVAGPQGVSPVDVAIGVLSLANFVQQRGTTHVAMKEYKLAGGAEGFLLSFVQQKLAEIPEGMQALLLKGIVLALVNASSNQRITAGETVAVIASKAELSESTLAPWLERLAHPRVRLLEKVGTDRYRLPHERLVPVLRRIAGGTLASLDQLRLLFEGEYAKWRETGNRRHLLGGKDLRNVLRRRDQFVQGETASGKTEYLMVCLLRRAMIRLAVSVAVVAAAITGYASYRTWDSSVQRQKLASWRLRPEVFDVQHVVDRMDIDVHPVNDLAWLRSTRMKELYLEFDGSHLAGLTSLKGLTSLSLDLVAHRTTSLVGLEPLKGLTSLSINLTNSEVTSLKGLEQLKRLTSLSLDLWGSQATSLAGLEQLNGLTSLSINLANSEVTSLKGLEQLNGLTSLSLDLRGSKVTTLTGLEQLNGLTSLDLRLSDVTNLAELEQLKRLTSVSLDLRLSDVTNLGVLEQLKGITSLSLNLHSSPVTSLAVLEQLKGLTSLSLDLHSSPVTSLAGLGQLKGLTSLSLDLGGSHVTSLAGLEQLKGLTSLFLNLGFSEVGDLAGLEQLKGLTSLSLVLGQSNVTSLEELEQLKGLTSLSLELRSFRITSLAGLEQLKGLTSLSLDLTHPSHVTSLAGLEQLKRLTSLSLNLRESNVTSLAELEQIKGLTSLSLDLGGSGVTNLKGLVDLKGLGSLSLNLRGSQVTSLAGLEQVTKLTSLWLNLMSSKVTSLGELKQLKGLTSIEIMLPASLLSSFSQLQIANNITQLWILMDENAPLSVPTGCKFVGLRDSPPLELR